MKYKILVEVALSEKHASLLLLIMEVKKVLYDYMFVFLLSNLVRVF
jgi:hypothetical protein